MVTLGEVVMILDLHRQGLSISQIARRLGIDRKTVRTYLARPTKSARRRRASSRRLRRICANGSPPILVLLQ